jgi:hypothetical protein
LHRTIGQVPGSFKVNGLEGEGVVGPHVAIFLDKEQLGLFFRLAALRWRR